MIVTQPNKVNNSDDEIIPRLNRRLSTQCDYEYKDEETPS